MKKSIILTLAAGAFFKTYAGEPKKSPRQPCPKHGFWVTEPVPGVPYTIVKYYANSITLVLEEKVRGEMDIYRRSVRKELDAALKRELATDSNVHLRELGIYQIKEEKEN